MIAYPGQSLELVQTSGSYRAWSLGCPVGGVIDLAWHSRSDNRHRERHHLLPFTEPSVALRRRMTSDGQTRDWDFVIFPAQFKGGTYAPARDEELFALRLAPEAMECRLHLSAKDYIEGEADLPRELLDRLAPATRLADQGDFEGAWCAMTNSLLPFQFDRELDRIGLAAGYARRSGGSIGPRSLAEQIGLSDRHMRRGFVDRLGLSPRGVLRRQRLTAAMVEAERCAKPNWADLAAHFGFSDQAHLIRECRSLLGERPVAWHRERYAMAVSFNT